MQRQLAVQPLLIQGALMEDHPQPEGTSKPLQGETIRLQIRLADANEITMNPEDLEGLTVSRDTCVFCEGSLSTGRGREHVIPQWLLDHLGIRHVPISPTHL